MSPAPKVSVIIPVYNVEQYLRKCLDSVCGQTYRNLEILCVNDGSTDGSAAILAEYAARDKRIIVINQQNSGQATARNHGLQRATGEWITGVDADDYLEADALESACQAIDSKLNIISFGIRVHWDNVQPDPHVDAFYATRHDENNTSASARGLLSKPCEFCSKIWRKSYLDSLSARFPDGIIFEDWSFFWAYAPPARCIKYLNLQKYVYVRRQGSTMSSAHTRNPRSIQHINALEYVLCQRRLRPLPPEDEIASLENFLQTCRFIQLNAPADKQTQAMQNLRYLAEQYQLTHRWPQLLQFLYPRKWWQKPFVTHRLGKSTYGIGPLKLVALHYKQGMLTTRLLGIKLRKSHL